MKTSMHYKKKQQSKPALTFQEWILKTVKSHKKRTNMDSIIGLIITVLIFLTSLVQL